MFAPVRARALLVAAGLAATPALLLGACSDGSTVAPDVPDPTEETLPQPASVVTVRLDVDSEDPEVVEQVADVLRARLEALGITRAEIGWDGSTVEVLVADGDEDELRVALAPPAQLEVRPVAVVLDDPAATVTTEVLGPAIVTGAEVESAEATEGADGAWSVHLVLTQAGIERFNEAAASCFATDEICPDQGSGRGWLAIVVDGRVVTTPAVNQATFERDQIEVSVQDESEATELAAALSGGTTPATWTVRD